MENYTLFSDDDHTYECESVYAYTKNDCIYMCGLTSEKCGDSYGTAYSVTIEELKTYFSVDTLEQILAQLKIIIHTENDIKRLLKALEEKGITHEVWFIW